MAFLLSSFSINENFTEALYTFAPNYNRLIPITNLQTQELACLGGFYINHFDDADIFSVAEEMEREQFKSVAIKPTLAPTLSIHFTFQIEEEEDEDEKGEEMTANHTNISQVER